MPPEIAQATAESWTLDYLILVGISSIGLYQIASVFAGLKGIGFLHNHWSQVLLGAALIAGAFVWFFLSEPNRNHLQHSVEGTQQLGLFLFGIVTAYIVTGILASLIQFGATRLARRPDNTPQWDLGMETLKHTTLIGGILGSIRPRLRR